MNETQRQTYLKAMGIQSYYPRKVLLGAKPSPQYDFDPMVESELPLGGSASSDKAPKPLAATTGRENSALDEMRAGSPSTKRQQSEKSQGKQAVEQTASTGEKASANVETAAPAAEQQDELRFSLNYYRISPTLAVINEVPHQNSGSGDGQVMALMKAILLALSIDLDSAESDTTNLKPESFSWPLLADMAEEENSPDLAAKVLAGFIKGRQEKDRFTNLLVFAGRSEELIMPSDDGARDFPSACGGFNITVSKTLHSMLVHPALKREVWQQLQPLRRRLATANPNPAG